MQAIYNYINANEAAGRQDANRLLVDTVRKKDRANLANVQTHLNNHDTDNTAAAVSKTIHMIWIGDRIGGGEIENIERIYTSIDQKPGCGCFITTACVNHRGLSDDCEELTVLREFRDTYLLEKPHGVRLIELYYEHSPKIVIAIGRREDEEDILKRLYLIIRKCVEAIKMGDNEFAFKTYCEMVMKLKEEFIPECQIEPDLLEVI